MLNQTPAFFAPRLGSNVAIVFRAGKRADFAALAVSQLPAVDIFTPSAGQFVARWRYVNGDRIDNMTDWGLDQFRSRYAEEDRSREIDKDAIFNYVYAVMHDPIYREKYDLNLKRDFPRIPFYRKFWKWADWGADLLRLHLDYQRVEPWPVLRLDVQDQKARNAGFAPKTILRVDREASSIVVDSETELKELPVDAWRYKIGTRSAIEWIIDQYKERNPKDPTIREKFHEYRFSDHKEEVIELLKKVAQVSVETVSITNRMKSDER
jgi:predicted helicase